VTGEISATMIMSALRGDVAQGNVSFLTLGKNETCADMFYSMLGRERRFVENA